MAARPHRAARLTLALVAAAATLAVSQPPALAAASCGHGSTEECGGHSDGTGFTGVIAVPGLPGGGGSGSSGGGRGCTDCEWMFVPACLPNGPLPGADAMCTNAAVGCPARGEPGILMRVYFRQGGGTWQSRGTVCIGGSNRVLTVADVAADAGEAYREQMRPGAARIGMYPTVQQVVNLPAYFSANGADPMTRTFGPAGVRMTITATPTYVWDFGDGATLETQSRGGPYPTGDVTHTYTSAATRTVTLTTRWSAEFTVVTGLGTFGPFQIGGPPVAPSTSIPVVVREARATGVKR